MDIFAEQNKQNTVRNNLIQWIQQAENGTRLLPERELAAMFSVSRRTIRNAVDGLVGSGLLTRMQGNGVYVTEPLSRKIQKICLVYGTSKEPVNYPFLSELLRHVESEVSSRGWILTAASMNETGELSVGVADADGLLITHRLDPTILPTEKPAIFLLDIEGACYISNTTTIVEDHYLSGRIAYDYLSSIGHRKVAYAGEIDLCDWAEVRYHGVCDAASKSGGFEPILLETDGGRSSGQKAIERIKETGVTAVICANDYVAVRFTSVLHRHGMMVPEDISILGFDDLPTTASFEPHLTTVKLPVHDMAALALSELEQRLLSRTKIISKRITLPAYLVERESCIPLKG
ncbi:MAG: LacI family DNA-binding transcriptional regulator [Armatimonadota bacterium]